MKIYFKKTVKNLYKKSIKKSVKTLDLVRAEIILVLYAHVLDTVWDQSTAWKIPADGTTNQSGEFKHSTVIVILLLFDPSSKLTPSGGVMYDWS